MTWSQVRRAYANIVRLIRYSSSRARDVCMHVVLNTLRRVRDNYYDQLFKHLKLGRARGLSSVL